MRAYATIQDAMSLGSGVERAFHCGNPDHSDRNASASVNSLTGAFLCYSCGWSGKIDVNNYEIDLTEAGRQLSKLVTQLEATPRELTESWLDQFDASGPGEYWLGRYGAPICRRFRLGMDYHLNAAVIPLRSLNGAPMGVIRRNLDNGPKYQYPKGVDISELLFNFEGCEDDIVVLTEGATDTIASVEVGYDAMAIYGSRMSKAQHLALSKYAPKAIMLCFDMDEAGDRAARDVTRMFPELITERVLWDAYKDLASMPVRTREQVLHDSYTKIVSRLAHAPRP